MNYENIYKNFIASRLLKNKDLSGYFEVHHIKPRSLGGSDKKSNLIKLTAREHFFAHLCLAKIHGGPMWHAINLMSNRCINKKSRVYAFAKEKFAKEHSEHMKTRYSNGLRPWNEGKTYSEEHKKILSDSHMGKKLSNEHKQKVLSALAKRTRDDEWAKNISNSLKGHTVSQSTREKISKTLIGNVPVNKGNKDRIVICPHCNASGGNSIMKRWHFDRCKKKFDNP
jgi:hypothetical protein